MTSLSKNEMTINAMWYSAIEDRGMHSPHKLGSSIRFKLDKWSIKSN